MKTKLKIEMYPAPEFFKQLSLRQWLADRHTLECAQVDIERCLVFCYEQHKDKVYVLGHLQACSEDGYQVEWFNFHPGRSALSKVHTLRYKYSCLSIECYDEIEKDAGRTIRSLLQLYKLLD